MNPAEPRLSSSTESDTEYDAVRPWIKSIAVPESVKRRLPSKHYVYKVVVIWTDSKKIIIYRKYSLFFDFVFKLNELVSKLSTSENKKSLQLPELPGRILFGRSEVHHVAEKRRKKIEEFCQKLIELPQEISQSPLVLGFFNTWPDDTMLRKPSIKNTHLITSPVIMEENRSESPSPPSSSSSSQFPFPTSILSSGSTSSTSSKSVLSPLPPPPPPLCYEHADSSRHSPSPSPQSAASMTDSTLESIISHPDEMEHLEQYRVLSNYERKDSHQVSLMANQLVHVIEKHDTGWWMVMSEDEQGYAPASYLDPVEENSSDTDIHPEDNTNQAYEAMESYFADNEDEITINAGDSVEVISKSMDGWWKIKCNGRVGYSPAALIRRRTSIKAGDSVGQEIIYESEKSIYEGLNIHRPPPRRNTIDRSNLKIHPHAHYNTPRTVSALHKANNIYIDTGEGGESGDEDTPKRYQITKNNNNINTTTTTTTTNKKSIIKPGGLGSSGGGSSSVDFDDDDEHIYEYDPSPIYEDTELEASGGDTNGSIYENTDFHGQKNMTSPQKSVDKSASINTSPSLQLASPPPPLSSSSSPLKKHPIAVKTKSVPSNSKQPNKCRPRSSHTPDDYEDPDALLEEEAIDYMTMDGSDHNTYIDPGDLRRINGGVSSATSATATAPTSSSSTSLSEPAPSIPGPSSASPDLRSNKKTPGFGGVQHQTSTETPTKGRAKVVEEPIFDDDYIEMDPVYTEPPLEEESEDSDGNTDTLKAERTPPKGSPILRHPLPPPPYRGNSPCQERALSKAKSLEDLIASFSQDNNKQQKSPKLKKKLPPNPPPRIPAPLSRLASSPAMDLSKGIKQKVLQNSNKPISRNGNDTVPPSSPPNSHSKSHLPHNHQLERSISPPTDTTDGFVDVAQTSPSHGGGGGGTTGRELSNSPCRPTKVAPSPTPKSDGVLPKTFVSVSNYISQTEGCLSFSVGDKCVLIQQTDGWWLVNIGGQEGWTPGEYWKEDIKRDIKPPKPPSFAPQKLAGARKPRSHTVGMLDSFSTPQEPLQSSATKPKDDPTLTNGIQGSPNKDSSSNKPIPPRKVKGPLPKPPQPKNKPVKPPKPALPTRPELPARPEKLKNSVLNNSPPTGRRNHSSHSPSPPPVFSSNEVNSSGSNHSNNQGDEPANDYEQLDELTTEFSIENSPWFVGKMERGQAEQFLMDHARQREFLIRERSTKDGYYALSIRYHYSCKHFNIDPSADGQYIMGVLSFPNIDDIIHHYQHNSLFIHEGQHVTLSQPVKKKHRPSDSRPHP